MSNSKSKAVFIINPTNKLDKDGKQISVWHPAGVAFVCKDGSLNVRLDSAPLAGQTINIRDFSTRDRRSTQGEVSLEVTTEAAPSDTSTQDRVAAAVSEVNLQMAAS